jgi:predicted nucleic acid-binding protein
MSGELDLQFVDTNILVYAYDSTSIEKNKIASQLLLTIWENRNGCLSIQVLQEFYICITRKVSVPVDNATASEIIRDLAVWKVHSPEANDILAAIELQQQCQISFWDAMMVWSAVAMGCKVIWSEDLNDGQIVQGVKIQNPFKNAPSLK